MKKILFVASIVMGFILYAQLPQILFAGPQAQLDMRPLDLDGRELPRSRSSESQNKESSPSVPKRFDIHPLDADCNEVRENKSSPSPSRQGRFDIQAQDLDGHDNIDGK